MVIVFSDFDGLFTLLKELSVCLIVLVTFDMSLQVLVILDRRNYGCYPDIDDHFIPMSDDLLLLFESLEGQFKIVAVFLQIPFGMPFYFMDRNQVR